MDLIKLTLYHYKQLCILSEQDTERDRKRERRVKLRAEFRCDDQFYICT